MTGRILLLVCVLAGSARADNGYFALGGVAGVQDSSAVAGGTVELGVPVTGRVIAHAAAATGGSEDLSLFSHTTGSFSNLRAGVGYRYAFQPGRRFEFGVDVGRQKVDWDGTVEGLFGGGGGVSQHDTNVVAIPRVVVTRGSADGIAELRVGLEGVFDVHGFNGLDLAFGVGFVF
jgi:hypothetical protein